MKNIFVLEVGGVDTRSVKLAELTLTARGLRLDTIIINRGKYLRIEAVENAPAYHVNKIILSRAAGCCCCRS